MSLNVQPIDASAQQSFAINHHYHLPLKETARLIDVNTEICNKNASDSKTCCEWVQSQSPSLCPGNVCRLSGPSSLKCSQHQQHWRCECTPSPSCQTFAKCNPIYYPSPTTSTCFINTAPNFHWETRSLQWSQKHIYHSFVETDPLK